MQREIRTIQDAISLLDEWEAAYRELERENLRMQLLLVEARLDAKTNESLAGGYQALYRILLDPVNEAIRADLAEVEFTY